MSQEHHFTLYTHTGGPNGWKVAIVLEELGLDYHSIYLEFEKGEQKAPEYVKYNPNGRIPALIDHKNNDFVIWESGAVIQYLVEKYDTEGKISVKSFEEKSLQLQWLFFQASGQGPYFGQIGWFLFYHPEKFPSAVERYRKEALRVLGVLESVLSKQEWLVGNKCTVADMSFVTWNAPLIKFSGGLPGFEPFDFQKEFPSVYKWHNTILSRPAVAKIFAAKEALTAKA